MSDGPDVAEMFRRAVQANARLSKGWMDLSLAYVRELSEILGGATERDVVQEVDSGTGALVLEGKAGNRVRGTFLVSNDMDKPVSCVFVASDFKDPRGAPVPAKPVFEPGTLDLGPGEQRTVQVSMAVDERLVPGVGHAGEISVKGMDGFSVPVVLRRQHVVEESSAGDMNSASGKGEAAPSAAPGAAPAPARKTSAKKGRKKAAR